MHMMPNTHAAPGTDLSPLAVGPVRGRIWLYLALTLLAVTLVVAGRETRQPDGRAASPAVTASHAGATNTLPAPPEDGRPPLTPDR